MPHGTWSRTIRLLKIDCDLRACDSVYYTLEPKEVAALRKEFRPRKRARLPGRWLSAASLYRMTGMTAQAAIATPGNAEVNPIRVCHGFLSAAVARGAKVFERSPARRIESSKHGVLVRTPGGTIEAKVVVIATGYARQNSSRTLDGSR